MTDVPVKWDRKGPGKERNMDRKGNKVQPVRKGIADAGKAEGLI